MKLLLVMCCAALLIPSCVMVKGKHKRKTIILPVQTVQLDPAFLECSNRSMVNFLSQIGQAYHRQVMVFRQPIDTSDDVLSGSICYRSVPLKKLLAQITKYSHYHLWVKDTTLFIEQKRREKYVY